MSSKFHIIALFIAGYFNVNAQDELNTIERAMKDELDRNMQELQAEGYEAPFFIRYRIQDQTSTTVTASLGSLQATMTLPQRTKEIRVMVGDYAFNDESLDDRGGLDNSPAPFGYTDFSVPLGDDYYGIRRSLWITTDAIYKTAAKLYKQHQTMLEKEGKTIEDVESRRFAEVPVVEYLEAIRETPFSQSVLEDFARQASEVFLDYEDLMISTVRVSSGVSTSYFLNSEGSRHRTSTPFTQVVYGTSKFNEKEGISYDAHVQNLLPGDSLPSVGQVREMIEEQLVSKIQSKIDADRFSDNYYGPVLFMGKTVPQLLSNYLVNYLEASTQVKGGSDYYDYGYGARNSTLDTRIGKRIISKNLSVTLHTTMDEWEGTALPGSYKIDGEGVMAPDTLVLVDHGILKNLMSGRTLVREGQEANGTGAGPGVVLIEAEESRTDEDLRQQLMDLAKANDQEYALIIKEINYGGLQGLNVYKVDLISGEEELLTGADVSDVDLNSLKRLAGISSKMVVNRINNTSFITPNALLIEDVGVSGGGGYQAVDTKMPLVASPLLKED